MINQILLTIVGSSLVFAQTIAIFILTDLRTRITRLENIRMKGSAT